MSYTFEMHGTLGEYGSVTIARPRQWYRRWALRLAVALWTYGTAAPKVSARKWLASRKAAFEAAAAEPPWTHALARGSHRDGYQGVMRRDGRDVGEPCGHVHMQADHARRCIAERYWFGRG